MSRIMRVQRQGVVSSEDRKRIHIGRDQVQRMSEELERTRAERDVAMIARRVAVPSRCSQQENAEYFIIFEEAAEGKWAVVDVSMARHTGPAGDEAALLTATGLDWTGYTGCPYCSSESVFKHCGRLSCQGSAYQKSGKTWVRCPLCGTTSYLEGAFDDVSGERAGDKGGKRK